jgi:UDP-N-acetylmuramoyl-L-alanyl-D-glutamate--2,6-diaminopimelate ligase
MQKTQARAAVSLRQTLPKAQILGASDVVVRGCSAEAAVCQRGDVYVAITTADDDGHEHAAAAVTRGAVAVVAERLLPVSVPQWIVRDSREAIGRVCQALAGNPTRQLRTIGITGSAGKTTTAMLMASILEAAGQAAGVMSSIGHSDSIIQQAASTETPTAAEFASWLARMSTAQCDAAVLEMPAQAIAERGTSGIRLDAAILTNIKADARQQNSRRVYRNIVARFLRHLKPDGVAIVNADDHRCRSVLAQLKKACLTYGLHHEADISASVIERCSSEQTFMLSAGDEVVPIRTRIIGDSHISNCLAATAAALASGIDLRAIARGLEAVERIPGRMERLECGQPFSVFVDAANTAETLSVTIRTLRQVTRGRVFVVYGPSKQADAAHRAMIGRVLERGCHVPVLTSTEPSRAADLAGIHQMLDGFTRPGKAQIVPTRATAIHFALDAAREGDCVLIAGRGDRGSQLDHDAKRIEDDREVACEWLYNRGDRRPATARFRVVG